MKGKRAGVEMLDPSEVPTTGLISAIASRGVPEDYREACITELAARIDRRRASGGPATADPPQVDRTEPTRQAHAATAA